MEKKLNKKSSQYLGSVEIGALIEAAVEHLRNCDDLDEVADLLGHITGAKIVGTSWTKPVEVYNTKEYMGMLNKALKLF